jgi:hypothetical protein
MVPTGLEYTLARYALVSCTETYARVGRAIGELKYRVEMSCRRLERSSRASNRHVCLSNERRLCSIRLIGTHKWNARHFSILPPESNRGYMRRSNREPFCEVVDATCQNWRRSLRSTLVRVECSLRTYRCENPCLLSKGGFRKRRKPLLTVLSALVCCPRHREEEKRKMNFTPTPNRSAMFVTVYQSQGRL